MSAAVAAGSLWRNRQTQVDALVIRLTAGGQVVVRRGDGKVWTIPLVGFVTNWEQTRGGHACARCGSSTLKLTDKYCKDCLSLIMRVRNARQHQEDAPVLTTTNQKLIEQKHSDAAHH